MALVSGFYIFNFFSRVKEGAKLGKVLEADTHSKMEIKFVVREAETGETVTVHQAFVAFVHTKTNQEIIFVATPNSARTYTFDLVNILGIFFKVILL